MLSVLRRTGIVQVLVVLHGVVQFVASRNLDMLRRYDRPVPCFSKVLQALHIKKLIIFIIKVIKYRIKNFH